MSNHRAAGRAKTNMLALILTPFIAFALSVSSYVVVINLLSAAHTHSVVSSSVSGSAAAGIGADQTDLTLTGSSEAGINSSCENSVVCVGTPVNLPNEGQIE